MQAEEQQVTSLAPCKNSTETIKTYQTLFIQYKEEKGTLL